MHEYFRVFARRGTVITLVVAGAIGLPAVSAEAVSPPPPPELVAPENGSSAAPGTSLSVKAGEAGGAPVDVTFHAAPRGSGGGAAGAPFTLLTLPDTQGYTITPTYTGILRDQLDWIAAQRSELNLAFVTGLGDIVDNQISAPQWTRASESMAILDDADVPYAVLPGNHDFNLATGDFTGYDTYFPVSRFRDAGWNSDQVRYGGHYGQNEFGPDAQDRQNMNSYSLFRAGGMDFMLLTLELNAPDGVLAWADRVVDAHPSYRVIVATHSYVFTNGSLANQVQRTDQPGNSGAQIFQKLVQPNCNIFLVVNGHFSDGPRGEANRVDQNACGQPVYGVLTDFQGRGNGGDGWLRYYRFDPSANQIEAVTYSPTRGEYERDADSSFTLAYDMTPPSELPAIGTVSIAGGGVASVEIPDVPDGTVLDWYATVDDGSASTRGPTWSVTVSAVPSVSVLAEDAFSRTVGAGWGTADTGGPWTVNSTAKMTVAAGAGRVSANAGSTLNATLPSVSTTDIDAHVTATIDRIPQQWLGLSFFTRQIGSGGYAARLRIQPTGAVTLEALRDSTVLASAPTGTATAGTAIHVRMQTEGTSPTTIRARAWLDGTTEPSIWQITTTDNTAALQQPGTLRLTTYLSSSATNGPVIVTYDNLTATTPGAR
ncbi:metallophosphoesterase [Microbacterium sp. MC2]